MNNFNTTLFGILLLLSLWFQSKGQILDQDQWVSDPDHRLDSKTNTSIQEMLHTFNSGRISKENKLGVYVMVLHSLAYVKNGVVVHQENVKVNNSIQDIFTFNREQINESMSEQKWIELAFKYLTEAGYSEQVVYVANQTEIFNTGAPQIQQKHALYVQGTLVTNSKDEILLQANKKELSGSTPSSFSSLVNRRVTNSIQALNSIFRYSVTIEDDEIRHHQNNWPLIPEENRMLNVTFSGYDQNQLAGLVWRIIDKNNNGQIEVCNGKASCRVDISTAGDKDIKILAGKDIIFQTKLIVTNNPDKNSSPVFSCLPSYSSEFGFDDASFPQLSGDGYETYNDDNGIQHLAPWVSVLKGQRVQLGLDWYSKEKDYKVTIRSTSPGAITVSSNPKMPLGYKELTEGGNKIIIEAVNTGKSNIIASDANGNTIGQLTVECRDVITKKVVFVHVSHDGTNYSREKDFVSNAMEILNKNSFNQIFVRWEKIREDRLDISKDFNPVSTDPTYSEELGKKLLQLYEAKFKQTLPRTYDFNNIYYVFLTDIPNVISVIDKKIVAGVTGAFPSNYCFLFESAGLNYQILVHELGHCLSLQHSFETTANSIPMGTTRNFMDYSGNEEMFFMYQSKIPK